MVRGAEEEGGVGAVRAAKSVQTFAMADLKRARQLLEKGGGDATQEGRKLEGCVAEMAGLLKEMLQQVKKYAETEEKDDRLRLQQLAQQIQSTYDDLQKAEHAMAQAPPPQPQLSLAEKRASANTIARPPSSGGGVKPEQSSPRPSSPRSPATDRPRFQTAPTGPAAPLPSSGGGGAAAAAGVSLTALDAACEELIKFSREGAKNAVQAMKQVQTVAMQLLRAAKSTMETGDLNADSRLRAEQNVAEAASLLKDLVSQVRTYAREETPEQQKELERLARALIQTAHTLASILAPPQATPVASSSGSGQKSPRPGSSLTVDQLVALSEAPAPAASVRTSMDDSVDVMDAFLSARSKGSQSGAAASPSTSSQRLSSPRPTKINTSSGSISTSPAPPSQAPQQPQTNQPYVRKALTPLKDPSHRLLMSALDDAVHDLCVWIEGQGPPDVLSDAEPETEEFSVQVRGPLCSTLASVFAYRFKTKQGWLGSLGWSSQPHFWYFISDYANNSSVNTVAGLSLQKTLKMLAADEKTGKDENAKFRSFVTVGLNQHKLGRWLQEIMENSPLVERFYDAGSVFADKESRTQLLVILRSLEKYTWSLNIHFEWIVRMRSAAKKAQTNGMMM